jgi:hypothetical protein
MVLILFRLKVSQKIDDDQEIKFSFVLSIQQYIKKGLNQLPKPKFEIIDFKRRTDFTFKK